jgi:hypothetical protein
MGMPSSSSPSKGELTNNLLVCAIFAGADVDEIEKRFYAGEPAYKVLEGANLFDKAFTNQNFAKTFDIRVYTADDFGVDGNVLDIILNMLRDSRVELRGSATTASLTIADEIVCELARVSAGGEAPTLCGLTIMPSPSIRTMTKGFNSCSCQHALSVEALAT